MTIRELVALTTKDIDQFEVHKGNFLDAFYRSEQDERRKMVMDEPQQNRPLPSRILPYIAAMVEKLCNDYNLECPKWVFSRAYYLDKPNFWMDAKGNLRLILLAESPVEFKMRNIFTTSNTLFRV